QQCRCLYQRQEPRTIAPDSKRSGWELDKLRERNLNGQRLQQTLCVLPKLQPESYLCLVYQPECLLVLDIKNGSRLILGLVHIDIDGPGLVFGMQVTSCGRLYECDRAFYLALRRFNSSVLFFRD